MNKIIITLLMLFPLVLLADDTREYDFMLDSDTVLEIGKDTKNMINLLNTEEFFFLSLYDTLHSLFGFKYNAYKKMLTDFLSEDSNRYCGYDLSDTKIEKENDLLIKWRAYLYANMYIDIPQNERVKTLKCVFNYPIDNNVYLKVVKYTNEHKEKSIEDFYNTYLKYKEKRQKK